MAYAAAAGAHRPAFFDTTASGGPLAHPLFPVCYEWPLLLAIRARAIGAAAAPSAFTRATGSPCTAFRGPATS